MYCINMYRKYNINRKVIEGYVYYRGLCLLWRVMFIMEGL